MASKDQTTALPGPPVKAIIFDLMGTCVDWHSTVSPVLKDALSTFDMTKDPVSALFWRRVFFDEIHARFEAGLPQEDIDETHRRTLLALLESRELKVEQETVEACVKAWHTQTAWADVTAALPVLRSKFDAIVLANGTARLQLDITKSAGLSFDMLLSSELLGLTKPDPAIYRKALDLLKLKPEDCVMVAAHAYDLRAARDVGMRTVYVRRWTEDLWWSDPVEWEEHNAAIRQDFDVYIDGREATSETGGFLELVSLLGL